MLPVAPELRKDIGERKRLINSADVVFVSAGWGGKGVGGTRGK